MNRNPGFSYVATVKNNVVGTLMAGHDGRRGYLQHLAVKEEYRGLGIATVLIKASLESLKMSGINKSHIFILKENADGLDFWKKQGWHIREELEIASISI